MLPRRICCLLLLLFPLCGAAEPSPSDDALQWLAKMARASQTLSYYGTFVYLHNGQIESMRIVHQASERGEQERLVHLNGAGREVIRNNDTVLCILPDDALVFVEQRRGNASISPLLRGDVGAVAEYYQFTIGAQERIAGRSARLITLQPKDAYRYGYLLWLDNETALLLRSDLVDGQAKVVEQIMFTDLAVVDAVPHEMLVPGVDAREYTWYRQDNLGAVDDHAQRPWQIGRMPGGFSLIEYYKRQLADSERVVDHLIVSDGLASISVFIEKLDQQAAHRNGPVGMGAVNMHAKVVDEHQVVVIGEVPAQTVQMIAESIQSAAGHDHD